MRKLRGFTLIELLVVIAIIAILATLVVTRLGTAQAKARVSDAKQDVTQVGKTIEAFKADVDSGSFPIAATVLSAANNCATPAGVAKKCNTESRGSSSSNTDSSTNWNAIFNGKSKVVPAGGSTYGIAIPKTPANGYIYTYYTAATTTAPTLGVTSASSSYSFVADIGAADASSSSNPRFLFYSSASGVGNNGSSSATSYTPVLP